MGTDTKDTTARNTKDGIRHQIVEWAQLGCETLVGEGATYQIPSEEGASGSRRRVPALNECQAAEKS